MKPEQRVIACVDQSAYADTVTDHAAWAALRMGAPLELLHVIDRHPETALSSEHSGAIGPDAQQALWTGPNRLQARQSMAQALGFYDMMATRGYERTELDRCLADNARAQQLQVNTTADFTDFGIRGTPSFALNGKTLDGVHSWQALAPQLNAQF